MTETALEHPTAAAPTHQDQAAHSVGHPSETDDQINLLDLFLLVLKYKVQIIATVGLAGVVAVVVSLVLPVIYRSEATIIPHSDTTTQGTGITSALGGLGGFTGSILGLGPDVDLTQLEVLLKSRELTHRVVSKYDLMPILFEDNWDPGKKVWTTDKPPTLQDAFRLISEKFLSISVEAKRGTLNVAFDHTDRQFARDMVDRYLTELSEAMREGTIRDSREKAAFVREELNVTSDALLRDKLYTLLANEIAEETFARAQKYFGFRVIDPPIVSDPDKRVKPRRALITMLSVFVAFFLAVFTVVLLEFIRKTKENATPEQKIGLERHLTFPKWP